MKKIVKNILIIAIVILVFSCKSYKVHHISNTFDYSKIKNNGIIYYLPKIELLVTIELTKTSYIKGIYSQYSEKLLNISNPFDNSFTFYNISKIAITPITLPDSNYMYFFEFPFRKMGKNKTIRLNFNDFGILSEVNTYSIKNKIKFNTYFDTVLADNKAFENIDQLVLYNLYEKTDTIIEKIALDSIVIEKKSYKTKTIAKSEEQKAIEIASIILDLQDAKMKLLTGEAEVPYDSKTIRYMCEQLELKKRQYLQLFTGQINQSKQIYQFFVNPSKINDIISICSFDKAMGINAIGNSSDIKITFEPVTKIVLNNKLLMTKKTSKSLYLKVPNCIKTVITHNDEVLYSQIINIPQFSEVIALPINKISLKLNEVSGSIQQISVQ